MSYSKEEEVLLAEKYLENPTRDTVNELAEQLDKPPRSIIAKLAHAGIYQAPAKVNKTGDPVVKKEEYVSRIEWFFDINLPTLAKTGKLDLKRMDEALATIDDEYRERFE